MRIKVNYEDVMQGANYLQNKANSYQICINSMYGKMHEMQVIWQGQDHLAFIEKLDQFEPQLKKMTQVIEAYAAYLKKSASLYQQLQQDRISKARNLV